MELLIEALPIIIVVLLVLNAGKGKKTSETKTRAPAPGRKPGGLRKPVDARTIGRTIAEEMKKEKPSVTDAVSQGEDPCHEYMLSPRGEQMEFHPSGESEFAEAGEGEDPCHVGNAAAPQNEYEYEETDVHREPLRMHFSEGIVMAEILKRPSERRRERMQYRYGKAANER